MHWLLHIPGQAAAAIGESPLRIGSDPGSEICLARHGLAPLHARLTPGAAGLLWLEPAADETAAVVHVNGRRIVRAALLTPGDELHLGSCALRLSSARKPDAARRPTAQPINFSGRVLLRALTGADTGRAHVLVNSLCIGRSDLSEVRIDDTALAERQILLQRQGNAILVKNLSPVSRVFSSEASLSSSLTFSIISFIAWSIDPAHIMLSDEKMCTGFLFSSAIDSNPICAVLA